MFWLCTVLSIFFRKRLMLTAVPSEIPRRFEQARNPIGVCVQTTDTILNKEKYNNAIIVSVILKMKKSIKKYPSQ